MTAARSPQVCPLAAHRYAGPRLSWGTAPSLSFIFSQHQASRPPEVGFFPQGGVTGGLEGPEENEEPLRFPPSSSKAHPSPPLGLPRSLSSGVGHPLKPRPPNSWSVLGGG